MDITDIFDEIRWGGAEFPREQLQQLIAEPAATRKLALEVMEEWLAKIEAGEHDPDDQGTFFALFLLGELREPKAYPLFLELLRFPNAGDDEILGDVQTQYMHKLLAAVAGGDTRKLLALAENQEADEFSRAAAVSALLVQLNAGEHSRDEVVEQFRQLFRTTERKQSAFWNCLIDDAADLQAVELLDDIKSAIQEGLPEHEMSMQEIEDIIRRPSAESYLGNQQNQPLGDWMSELEEWSFEDEPEVPAQKPAVSTKISRNDPCPCGSGKKHKKCCMAGA